MGNSPFFKGNESENNPFRKKAMEDINAAVRPGFKKGKSTSRDASGKKYPLGFTPPVDFYVNQDDFEFRTGDDDLGSTNPNDTGLFISRKQKGGVDLVTGRHIEYGRSITFRTEDDTIAILGAGPVKKTLGNAFPINYAKNYLGEAGPAFSPKAGYIVPDEYSAQALSKGVTNSPIEYGNIIYNSPKYWMKSKIWERLGDKYAVYDNMGEISRKNFTHLLDYFQDPDSDPLRYRIRPSKPKYVNEDLINIFSDEKAFAQSKFSYVGDPFYLQTSYENEDPTYYGFNLKIKTTSSPLLNGDIPSFLTLFGDLDSEINSRKNIYLLFKRQLAKFFITDLPITDDSKDAKTYYIQSITGLNKLVENFSTEEKKQFAEFGKDLITLDFVEDVTQNIGYLASLYRYLTYSKLRGKIIIPENLLRFDIDIEVTEIRKMNRQVVDPNDKTRVYLYSDEISRYVYTCHECKFKFEGMPHGDVIKNNDIGTEAEPFKINFDYKFSTLAFEKFSGRITYNEQGDATMEKLVIDNKSQWNDKKGNEGAKAIFDEMLDTKEFSPYRIDQSHEAFISDRLAFEQRMEGLRPLEPHTLTGQINGNGEFVAVRVEEDAAPTYGEEEEGQSLADIQRAQRASERERKSAILEQDIRNSGFSRAFDQLKAALANAAIRQANRLIITQAALLNKTIENIRNSVPYAGRMSEPTNVYTGTNAFKNDAINAARNFASDLIRGAFMRK